MALEEIKTLEEFNQFIAANQLVAVDFTASWSGPSGFIGSKFEEMAKEFPNVKFIKVDVDANSKTAKQHGLGAMSVIKFFHNGVEVSNTEVVKSSKVKLKESLNKLSNM